MKLAKTVTHPIVVALVLTVSLSNYAVAYAPMHTSGNTQLIGSVDVLGATGEESTAERKSVRTTTSGLINVLREFVPFLFASGEPTSEVPDVRCACGVVSTQEVV